MYTSLDGYIEAPNGEWVAPDWSDDLEEHWSGANLDRASAVLYGRVCYEGMAQYWQSPDADPRVASRLKDLPKYVASSSMREATWANTTIVRANLADEVRKLKAGAGKDIVAFGGAGLVASLVHADLVDEYRIMVVPMLFGGGKPLFPAGFKRTALKLVSCKVMDTGALISHYTKA